MRLAVAGHSRTMAYTASALDVYLQKRSRVILLGSYLMLTFTKKSFGEYVRLNKGKLQGTTKVALKEELECQRTALRYRGRWIDSVWKWCSYALTL